MKGAAVESAVLLVDDEDNVLKALQRTLMDEEFEVDVAHNGFEAEKMMAARIYKVIVSDERMPGLSGSELLSRVSLQCPQTVRILLTGQASLEATMRAVNSGEIYRFFVKPWNDVELKLALRSAIEKYDLEIKNRELLALARCQAMKLSQLGEKPQFRVNGRRTDGSFCLPELSEDEIDRIMKENGIMGVTKIVKK